MGHHDTGTWHCHYFPAGLKILLLPLDQGDAIEEAYGDMIFVFGAGMLSYENEFSSTLERLDKAADLYSDHTQILCVSEGNLDDTVKFKELVNQRFDNTIGKRAPIMFDLESTNTISNCLMASEIAGRNRFNEVILVTSLYHQGRVQMIARKVFSKDYRIAKMDNQGRYEMKTFQDWHWSRKRIIREYLAIAKDFFLIQFIREKN